jgi:hypothetical protein
VDPRAPEQQEYWIIQPLIEAGLELDAIRALLFRLAFEAVIDEGRCTVVSMTSLVSDQPVGIRTAWTTTIDRMITAQRRGAFPTGPAPSVRRSSRTATTRSTSS